MIRSLALGLMVIGAAPGPAVALDLTPSQTEGPYYPRRKPADTDPDLTRIGSGPVAKGEILGLAVQVLDPQGQPVSAARVEIWQVDHQGIYLHPDDPRVARRDADFQAYGEARTDGEGRARFVTIRPPAYEGRPAHIHLKVTPKGGATLTTQLYFADDASLARDSIARRLGKALERVTLRPARGADGKGPLEAVIAIVVKARR